MGKIAGLKSEIHTFAQIRAFKVLISSGGETITGLIFIKCTKESRKQKLNGRKADFSIFCM